jgi:septum site-determining protein MinD
MAKVYVITSGKGGTGKTTTAVNLGAALNKFDEDVVIVDTNIMTPNIGLHFGAPIVPVSLSHVLKKNADLEEAIYEHESGTKIIPSSLSIEKIEKGDKKELRKISKKLKKLSNHIILDSAAGLGPEAEMAIISADEAIIVTNPNTLSVTDALKAIKTAKKNRKEVKGVIITRVKNKKSEMSLEEIKDMLEVPILGVVPEDDAIDEALSKKNAVIHTHPKSKAAKSYLDIAAKILGKKKKPKSLFLRLLENLGF